MMLAKDNAQTRLSSLLVGLPLSEYQRYEVFTVLDC